MPRIKLGECPRQTMEHFIDKHTDRAQRMIGRNPPLNIHVADELDCRLVTSAHRALLDPCESIAANHTCTESHPNPVENRLFQQPASSVLHVRLKPVYDPSQYLRDD